jgi:hypothetical protein
MASQSPPPQSNSNAPPPPTTTAVRGHAEVIVPASEVDALRTLCLDEKVLNAPSNVVNKLKSHCAGSSKRASQIDFFPEVKLSDDPQLKNDQKTLETAKAIMRNIINAGDALFIRTQFNGDGTSGGVQDVVKVKSDQQRRAVVFDVDSAGNPSKFKSFSAYPIHTSTPTSSAGASTSTTTSTQCSQPPP